MNKNELVFLFEYNRWANARVITACRMLAPQQITAPAQTSFGSLMGTLVHVYATERFWRLRLQEHISPDKMPTSEDFVDLEALVTAWQEEETRMQNFVGGLGEAETSQWVEYVTTSGTPQGSTMWKALVHVVTHGAQFRGEIGAVLAGLGHSPGDLDFLRYQRESGQR